MSAHAQAIQALRAALKAKYGHTPGVVRRKRPLPRQAQPRAIELSYFRELRGYLGVCRAAIERFVTPRLGSLVAQRGDAARYDSAGEELRRLVEQARKALDASVTDRQLERLARQMGQRTTDKQKEELGKQLRAAVGVNLATVEPNIDGMLADFVATNVALIKTISSRYFDAVETTVLTGIRGGKRPEELQADIKDRFDVSESQAALIARDQTLKLYGEVNKARQEELGVTGYTWRATPDNRTRPEHVERDGEHFEWDDPPADGHPGFPINCRCSAEPDLSGILASL